jgi:hypothetical protein
MSDSLTQCGSLWGVNASSRPPDASVRGVCAFDWRCPAARTMPLTRSHRPLLLSRTCEADVQRGERRDAQRSQQEEQFAPFGLSSPECAQEGRKRRIRVEKPHFAP